MDSQAQIHCFSSAAAVVAELGERLRAQQPAPLPLVGALVALAAAAPPRVLRGEAPRLLPWLIQVRPACSPGPFMLQSPHAPTAPCPNRATFSEPAEGRWLTGLHSQLEPEHLLRAVLIG